MGLLDDALKSVTNRGWPGADGAGTFDGMALCPRCDEVVTSVSGSSHDVHLTLHPCGHQVYQTEDGRLVPRRTFDGFEDEAPEQPMYPERAGREGDSQPLPTHNDSPDIQSLVIQDISERRELGIRRYGTALQANNGRNALVDAYEEALDLAMYLKQLLVEEGRE